MSIAYVSVLAALGIMQVLAQNSSDVLASSESWIRTYSYSSTAMVTQFYSNVNDEQFSESATTVVNANISVHLPELFTGVSSQSTTDYQLTSSAIQNIRASDSFSGMSSLTTTSFTISSLITSDLFSTGSPVTIYQSMTSHSLEPSEILRTVSSISEDAYSSSVSTAFVTAEVSRVIQDTSLTSVSGVPFVSPSSVSVSVTSRSSSLLTTSFQELVNSSTYDLNVNTGTYTFLAMSSNKMDSSTDSPQSAPEPTIPLSHQETYQSINDTTRHSYYSSEFLTPFSANSGSVSPTTAMTSHTSFSGPVSNVTSSDSLTGIVTLDSADTNSFTQISSAEMTTLSKSVVSQGTAISESVYSFRTAISTAVSTTVSVNSTSESSISYSGLVKMVPSLSFSASIESVSFVSENVLTSYASSSQNTGIISVPGIETNQTSVLVTESTNMFSHATIISTPISTLLASQIQTSYPIQTPIETQISDHRYSSSYSILLSSSPSTSFFSSKSTVTELGLSTNMRQTTVSQLLISDTLLSVLESLRPSFTASTSSAVSIKLSTVTETFVHSLDLSSKIEESALGTETRQGSSITASKLLETSTSFSAVSISPSSVYVMTSATPVITKMGDLKFIVEFTGDCDRLILNAKLQIEFWQALIAVLSIHSSVHIQKETVQPEKLSCKPFQAIFVLKGMKHADYVKFTEQNLTIAKVGVPILDEMSVVEYEVESFKVIPLAKIDAEKPKAKAHKLDKEDIIIIILAGVLFGFLLCMCLALGFRECYRRRRAASFNLLDVPHVNLDLDDFTLMKIPRPRTIYQENNAIDRVSPFHNGNRYTRPKDFPINDMYTSETLKIRPVSTDSIQVRIQPHPDGVVVGVTCTPPRSPTLDCTPSEHSSPSSETSDPSKQTLLKSNDPQSGISNPNFERDDEVTSVDRKKYEINEDEDEALL